MADATWRELPDFEGAYEVSDLGEVRSIDRWIDHPVNGHTFRQGRVLKQTTCSRQGYKKVNLSFEGVRSRWLVHVLVMRAFVGPRPTGFHTCHNNGDPADNRLVNLRYDTPSSNAFDSVDQGTCFQSSKDSCPVGHLYNEANTRFVKTTFGSGIGRQCRECDRERQLAKRAANRETYNAAARERRRLKSQAV